MKKCSGMQIFHNGKPMQLLYLVDEMFGSQIWRVKPLFVEEPEHDEVFELHDRISFIHTSPVRGSHA